MDRLTKGAIINADFNEMEPGLKKVVVLCVLNLISDDAADNGVPVE